MQSLRLIFSMLNIYSSDRVMEFFFYFADKTEKIKINVKPAEDFPVDLYYLMDMSKSMEDDLLKLRTLGSKIG